jgi:Binding-prot-dependent transport system membrane comp, N-term
MGLLTALTSIVHRLLLIVAVIGLNFTLIHLAPGDPVEAMVGEWAASPELIAKLRSLYGLDKGFPEQLWIYMKTFLSAMTAGSPNPTSPRAGKPRPTSSATPSSSTTKRFSTMASRSLRPMWSSRSAS